MGSSKRATRIAPTLALAVAAAFCGTGIARAEHAGDLDVTFDGDGQAETAASFYTGAQGMATESDGSILVATGRTTFFSDPGDAFILRIGRDGGAFSTLATLSDALFSDVLVQPDGKIVAVGSSGPPGGSSMLAARFLSDGTLDTSFAGDGTHTSSDAASAVSVALDPDGKLVVAGDNVLKRLNPDGTEDQTYTGPSGRFDAVAMQADGKPVAVGRDDTDKTWLIVRLTSAFVPDPSFAPPALDFADFSAQDLAEARDLAIQPDGRIVVAGQSRPDNGPAPIVRLLDDGTLDPSWDHDGILLIPPDSDTGIPGATVSRVAVDAQGRILAQVSRVNLAPLLRFASDGSLDPAFSSSIAAADLEPLPDGRILADFSGSTRPADPPPPLGESIATVGVARLLGTGIERPSGPATRPGARCGGRQATIVGSERSDTLSGTNRRDVIASLGGNDRIKGLRGNDLVCGGPGRDRLFGGPGRDRLLGGPGKDKLVGGPGRDRLLGGSGKDKLVGGPGRDRLLGGPGKDKLVGGPGRDRLKGGKGADRQAP